MFRPNAQPASTPARCPRWCEDPVGHPFSVESHPDDTPVRYHGGAAFGGHLSREALEFEGETELHHQVRLIPDDTKDLFDNPTSLIEFAADAVSAALWLQARTNATARTNEDELLIAPEVLAELKRAFDEFIDDRIDKAVRAQLRRVR